MENVANKNVVVNIDTGKAKAKKTRSSVKKEKSPEAGTVTKVRFGIKKDANTKSDAKKEKTKVAAKKFTKEDSVQIKFVEAHKDSEDLRKQSFEKHSLLYKWQGSSWNRLQEVAGEGFAWDWLKRKEKAYANEKNAKSCMACLKYEIPEVPDEPTETIIPLKNAWLRVNPDTYKIEVINPTKDYFVDYSLDISIERCEVLDITANDEILEYFSMPERMEERIENGKKKFVEIYKPSQLPEGSLFKQFIETSMPNAQIRELLQEYCGYTLMKGLPFQVAQVWEGNGSNGKSVLIAIMEALHKNSRSVDLDNLTPTELNKLIGASLVISPETPKKAINEQTLKKCISGDLLSVRALFENSVDYRPTAKWIISCNQFPILQDDTNGIWRRLQIFKWEVEFAGKEIIRDLEKKIIKSELRIVLDWCLTGLMRLLEREGFDTSAIDAQKEEKKVASDNVLQFIKHVGLAVDTSQPIYQKEKGDVYTDYTEYCEVNGFHANNSVNFWKKVRNKLRDLDEQRRTIRNQKILFVNLKYEW